MYAKDKETYLGFDLSTQKLKAVQVDSNLEVIAQAEVKFDIDLPDFETTGGVNCNAESHEFYIHPIMWIKAIDIVLDRLVVQGAELHTVIAISGSAQQHGSLYWSAAGIETLENLDADKFLHTQLNDNAFTIQKTPIWMDGSTERQCNEMESSVGGREKMVHYTGSKCYARFTGPQIRKIHQTQSNAYENTVRISLVSSFLASIFLGKIAPIDYSDGSGMNLLDINTKSWSMECLSACAPNLAEKLGTPTSTSSIIGSIGTFFVQRYAFHSKCKVCAFTGDNPSALAGMLIGENWLAMSLGTSDTIMMGLKEPTKMAEGHVLVHPTDDNSFMGLLCFRNGSLVRDIFKRAEGNNNWEYFSELLDSTPIGNGGNMALHFMQCEIIPRIQGSLRWNSFSNLSSPEASAGIPSFLTAQTEIRALIEGQMLHRKAVATDMGFSFGDNTRILTTGGSSINRSILQVVSDVFGAPVYTQKSAEAALLGSAFRAKYVMYLHGLSSTDQIGESYYDFISRLLPNHMQRICDPTRGTQSIYSEMEPRFRDMVKVLTATMDELEN